jgi:hypothetical protein
VRFHHEDFGPIRTYLTAEPCEIRKLEWDLSPPVEGYAFLPWTIKRRPAHPPQPSSIAEIEDYFHRADIAENAGTVLHDYFHINAPASERAVSLNGAVEHVEAYGTPNEFLLAGYHDGGLISVSRRVLPFQDGVAEIDWWGPR